MPSALLFLPAVLTQDLDTTTSSSGDAAVGLVGFVLYVAVYLFYGYCYSLIFKKDSVTPWWGYIPILNLYGIIKLVGREPIWIIGVLIPCVNFIVIVVLMLDLAKAFGKDVVYALGLIFLPFIFFPVLAFGSATYVGPVASAGGNRG